jgi:hypothetical protein
MNAKEVRIRCIEAIAGTAVREVTRLIADARALEEWVNGAEDKQVAPRRGRPPKDADKE